ncbi:unnamed protein product [Cylicostephanus goldi]|uniref:Uncharacterized protein n=1 Tax=Cylicostephanus goldi TaxID=71465 RepID=A0A3P6RR68_CYLGO|nr:unnamed protein product [Cylicostephanus goldi]
MAEEKRKRLELETRQIEEENRRILEDIKRYEEPWQDVQQEHKRPKKKNLEKQKRPKKKKSVKVVRNSPYRKKQVKKKKIAPTPLMARSTAPSKRRIAAPAQKVRRPKKKAKVIVKRPWAYVGDPTLRAYRTREQSYLSDFHF